MRRWSVVAGQLMAGEPVDGGRARHGCRPGRRTVLPDGDVRVRAHLLRPHGAGPPQTPAGTGPTARLLLGPSRREAVRDGDLWVQIGADDALVAFHALRALQKEAAARRRLRWQMNGFNRAPGATDRPMTARNLMGQVDGTNNPKPAESDFDERIFVPSGGPSAYAWMAGGSYAVVRRIRMLLDDWEKLPVGRQEQVIGRRKADGAPLSGGTETTAMDLDKAGADGRLLVPATPMRVSPPPRRTGAPRCCAGRSRTTTASATTGTPDAGLLFVCWQADPFRGFIPVQRKLDRGDALSPFIRHEASGSVRGAREVPHR